MVGSGEFSWTPREARLPQILDLEKNIYKIILISLCFHNCRSIRKWLNLTGEIIRERETAQFCLSMCRSCIWFCLEQKSMTCCRTSIWLIDASKQLASLDNSKIYILANQLWTELNCGLSWHCKMPPKGGQFGFGFTPIKSHPKLNIFIVRKTCLFLVCLCWCPAVASLLNCRFSYAIGRDGDLDWWFWLNSLYRPKMITEVLIKP